jgi:hypothetical protein
MENIAQIMNLVDKPRPSPTSSHRGEAKKGAVQKEGSFFQSAVGAGSKPALTAMYGNHSSDGRTIGHIESFGLD